MDTDTRDELLGRELNSAVAGIYSRPDERLPYVLGKGSRLRALRMTAIAGALALFIVPLAVGALILRDHHLQPTDQPSPILSPSPVPTPRVVTSNGISVTLPPGWQQAKDGLMPNLGDPHEILSAGTFELLPNHGSTCAQYPVTATEQMGSRDAFVSILERGGSHGNDLPRPKSFQLPQRSTNDEWPLCLSDPSLDFFHWTSAFDENGREMNIDVAIGPDASPDTKREVTDFLNSILVGAVTDGPPLRPGLNSDKQLGLGMHLPVKGVWIDWTGAPAFPSSQEVMTLSSYQRLVNACPDVPEGEVAITMTEDKPTPGEAFDTSAYPLRPTSFQLPVPQEAILRAGCVEPLTSELKFSDGGRYFKIRAIFGPNAFDEWHPVIEATLGSLLVTGGSP